MSNNVCRHIVAAVLMVGVTLGVAPAPAEASQGFEPLVQTVQYYGRPGLGFRGPARGYYGRPGFGRPGFGRPGFGRPGFYGPRRGFYGRPYYGRGYYR